MFFYWRHVRTALRIAPDLRNPGDRIRFAAYAGTPMQKFLPLRQRLLLWIGKFLP